MATQIGYLASELGAYLAEVVVGTCTKSVDARVLSSAGSEQWRSGLPRLRRPGGAHPVARARRLGRAVPGLAQRRGRLLRRRLRRVRRVEATRGLEGCGRLFGAVLAVSRIFAPLYYQSRLRLLMNEQECGDSQSLEINQLSFVLITCFRLLGILSGHIFASVRLRTVDAGQASPTALHHRFARPCWNRLLERYLRFFRCSRKPG